MRTALACWLAAIGLLVAGCGGSSGAKSNGVTSQTPEQILTSMKSALASAKSVHVVGHGVSAGRSLALDLTLERGTGGSGTISFNGLSIQIVKDGDKLYFKGGAAFLKHYAGSAASLLAGKWIVVPATTKGFSTFASLTDIETLIGGILGTHGTLAKGQTTTISGRPALAITDTTNGGTLYVATTGPVYPLQLKPKSGKGVISFQDWDQPVTITPPSNAVDLSTLIGGGG